ncbi:MAG TPA: fibronectin type III domain-containing protein, partial [Dermatophilaceae bacterium]
IHAGTGYPMCVPRTDPATADDALCPQANRPKPGATGQCRNFSVSGIAPPVSGELTASVGLPYCSQFVMPSVAARAATDPDPRQQAPFEVGDSITFSGTLIPATATAPTYTSAHTVEANIGIYTMPGTQPSYLAIGDFGVGTADPNAVSINGFATETQDRIFLESETTDVKTPVDIYMQDVNSVTGAVRNRWVTPFEMTGEQNGPLQADGVTPIGGGITTQQTGPQPQRARLRATKAPVGLLSQPTRTVRVAVRSLCVPQAPVNDAAGNPVLTSLDACLNKNDSTNQVANGLEAGQYFAPTFEYIFPENVKPGDLLVPFDLWHLPFLRYGEGATTQSAIGPAVGPLEPTPWGGPSATVPGAPTIGAATGGDSAATVTWTPPASDGGAPITGYTVNALDGTGALVGTVKVAGNVTSATVTSLTNGTAVTLQVVATNLVGTGPASAPSNAVTPTAAAPAASAVALNPASVTGGTASTGTVTLTSAAPTGDAVVSLASSATAATVPASVTVPAGATSATFSIGTTSVTASTPATITATYGGATASATLTVTSATVTSTSLSTVSVNPTTVTGGTASQGTVLLTAAAPAGGSTVGLTSSSATVTVPANVTVAAGALIATFPVTTSAVTASTSATITASDGAVTRTASLTVTPVAAATLTVTATGRTGETVSSNPVGIRVAVGSTGTASFATNTSITLSVTNGRSVVWSGACSSGGAKVATCTFTITANASVTGNVQ